MKMLAIMCREQFEDEVLALFGTLGITGYTVIHRVGRSGETGAVSLTHPSSARNRLLRVALDDDRMATLVQAVRQLQARLVQAQSGYPVPFKAFLQPCEPVV
jgi:nitrogen regulatory protein PII